jgi:hypothetical protein
MAWRGVSSSGEARSGAASPVADAIGTCRHAAAVADASPDECAAMWSARHTVCPTCETPLELRLMHPAAGGCTLTVEERWLAGRTFVYQRVDDRWDALS